MDPSRTQWEEDPQKLRRGAPVGSSWSASTPFAGDGNNGELGFDWGLNASLLFGRQKVRTHHQTTARYHGPKYAQFSRPIEYQLPATPDHIRGRSVIVPDIGAFAGVSWRYQNAKVSFGYRADEFFGAMDGGIDTHKNENLGFFGPYVKISIGLGG